MEIIPAIDLRDGRCVRLYQGDYDRETVFADDPVEVALRWQGEGARRLHVVDLDGAKAGRPLQAALVEAMARGAGIPVQVGGGIRDAETVRRYLAAGVDRCVLGTAAVQDPGLVARLVAEFGPAIVVGVDAREGKVATAGWTDTSELSAAELAGRLERDTMVDRFIFTDIGRDGTLLGPNHSALQEFVGAVAAAVIASGGVASLDDIRALRTVRVEGVIVGRALYAGTVTLGEAIAVAGGA